MHLLCSLHTPDDAFFRNELSRPSATVATTWHYTRAVPPDWHRATSRLDTDALREETLPPEQKPLIYICGSTGFVEAVARALIELGHAPESIRTERFGGS